MEVRAPEGRAQAAGTRLMPGEPGRRLMIDRLLLCVMIALLPAPVHHGGLGAASGLET